MRNSCNSEKIANTSFENIVCAPYFVLAIVVDLFREVLALATRTYATFTESPEGCQQNYWHASNAQFMGKC